MNLPDLLPYFDSWKRSGNGKFVASCPMPNHSDSDPSVTITQDIETGKILMMCWGCNTKAPELIQALGLRSSDLFGDPGHPAAVTQIQQQESASEEEIEKLTDYTIQSLDKLFLAKDYILTRFGLSEDDGYNLSLGVDPGDSSITRPTSCAAFNSGTPHLIIPFMDPKGALRGMQGRRLVPGEPRWRSVSGSGWSKIGCFGWDLEGTVIITEGPSDALSVVGMAKLPAIAVRGASNTDEATCAQIKEWLNGRPAIVVGDNGEAGEKFARELSQRLGLQSWLPPAEFSDLADYLGAGGDLKSVLETAAETITEPGPTPAEVANAMVIRLTDNIEEAIFDVDLMRDLHAVPNEEQEVIFARVIRQAPHGQIGDYRGFVRAIQRRLRAMPTPPAGGGGNGQNQGGPGHPIPGQIVVTWNPEDQLHVTEDSVRNAMDHYSGAEYYQASPGQYVKVVTDELVNLKEAGLRSMLSQMGHWRVINGQQERGHVPSEASRMISDPSWECGVPIIKRRVEVPFMLENGDIVSEQGFHEESGIYLLPRFGDQIVVPEVPMIVTDEDVRQAKEVFEDVIEGFDFKNNASRTNLIAMTLTSPLRELFKKSPMVPLMTSTAPQSGSGKGTSVRVPLSTVGIGPNSLSTTAYNSDENEFEKKIVGQLLKKSSYIFLDNIRAQVNSAVMEQMLTAPNYDGRTLGYSEVNRLSTLVLWVCTLQSTGSFNRDLTRRCVPVELTKNWRGSWKHKNIDAYLASMRGKMIWACFIVARRWIEMGRPISTARLDGYGGWTETIGGILEHVLGYEDFLGNLESFRKQQDQVALTIDSLLERWLRVHGEEEHPARLAVDDLDDPALHKLLGLHNNPGIRQVQSALERQLISQAGYIIGTSHRWEFIGEKAYGHEMKRLFRCTPLQEEQ